jgi:hypothetical protein
MENQANQRTAAAGSLLRRAIVVGAAWLSGCLSELPPEAQPEELPENSSIEKAHPPKYIGEAAYGTRRVLAVLMHSNDETEPVSADALRDVLFSDKPYSLSSWYDQCSAGQASFVPSEFGGIFEVDVDQPSKANHTKFSSEAKRRFQEQFGRLMDFSTDYILYCYPHKTLGAAYAVSAIYNDGVPETANAVFLAGKDCLRPGTIIHELGHQLGLLHAGANGDDGRFGAYSDNTDVMGSALTGPQCFNGPNTWRLGWYRDQTKTITPNKDAAVQVTLAAQADHEKARSNEYVVAKVGDYYLEYEVKDPDPGPNESGWKPWEQRGISLEQEMDGQVAIVKNIPLPEHKSDSIIYGGVGIEQPGLDPQKPHLALVKSVYGIERFDGEDTLYVKACSRSEGSATQPRSMTVSIGYDPLQLCGATRSKFGFELASAQHASEKLDGSATVVGGVVDVFGAGADEKRLAVRFSSLDIPKNAVIKHAYVQFESAVDAPQRVYVKIDGEKATSSRTLAAQPGDLSNRPRTSSTVLWKTQGWEAQDAGFTERTPNLKDIIQELVNQPAWQRNGAISLLFERFYQGRADRRPQYTLAAAGQARLFVAYDYVCQAGQFCPSNLLPSDAFEPGEGDGAGETLHPIQVPTITGRAEHIAIPGVRFFSSGSAGTPATLAFDGNLATAWVHDLKYDDRPYYWRQFPNLPWVQYQLAEGKLYSSYRVAFPKDITRAPKGWHLYGYDGASWQLLDRQALASASSRMQKVYPIAGPGRYLRYHFVFDANPQGSFLEINEITLIQASHESKPWTELVAQTFVLKSFEAAATVTRLPQELASSGSSLHTLFIPWDAAFQSLPYWKKITTTGPWREHLRDLLLGHIAKGDLPQSALVAGLKVPMLNGTTALVARESRPTLDGTNIASTATVSDGTVHLLQGVRAPAWSNRTILDVLRDNDESFSRILDILARPGMESIAALLADKAAGVTFLAPTDSAVTDELYGCQGAACAEMVRGYLVNPILSRRYTPSTTLTTQSAVRLTWTADAKTVRCTGGDGVLRESALVGDEGLAVNGVVQPIGAPLCKR